MVFYFRRWIANVKVVQVATGLFFKTYTPLPFAQHHQPSPCLQSPAMSTTPAPKTGQTWHLPASGNTVEITSKGRDGEMRCTYVETADRPELGGAAAFGSTCLLSADFLQKHGVLRDGD